MSGTDLGAQGADGYAVGEWCENKSVFAFRFSGLPCLFPPFFLVLKVFFGAPTLVRLSPGSLQQQFLWEGFVATRGDTTRQSELLIEFWAGTVRTGAAFWLTLRARDRQSSFGPASEQYGSRHVPVPDKTHTVFHQVR